MKRYVNIAAVALAACTFCRCTPDDGTKLGEKITDLKIIVTATSTPNVFHLEASRRDIIGFWDLGNGLKISGANEALAEYPFANTYTVNLTALNSAGKTNSATVKIPVMTNNLALLSDPIYELIAGEIGSESGKTWVMDSLLYGHITNQKINSTTQAVEESANNSAISVTAPALPNIRSGELRMGKTLYDDKATFLLNTEYGQGFKYVNNGSSLVTNTGSNAFKDQVFLKTSSWSPTTAVSANSFPLPAGFTGTYNSDWQINCTPPEGMTWYLTRSEGSTWINFSPVSSGQGGFLFFALGWKPYRILSINENRMVVQIETFSGNDLKTRSVRRVVMIKEGTPSGLPPQTADEETYIYQE